MSCPDCFKGAVHNHGTPKGDMVDLYGRRCYVSPAPPGSTSSSTIFFATDAFGLSLVNNKLLSDTYAAETGFKVVMPEIIPHGSAPISLMNYMDTLFVPVRWSDLFGQLRRAWNALRVIVIFVPFMIRSGPTKGVPAALDFARKLKNDLPVGAKLGIAGFCWGGYISTELCKYPIREGSSERLIDAQFCAHPSALKAPDMVLDAVSKFHVPYSVAIGDLDFVMAIETVEKTEAALREKVGRPEENDYEIRTYPGCRHGFAVRAMPENKVEQTAAEEAKVQAVEWFKKYL